MLVRAYTDQLHNVGMVVLFQDVRLHQEFASCRRIYSLLARLDRNRRSVLYQFPSEYVSKMTLEN